MIWHKHKDVPDGTGSNWIIESREVSNWHWDDYVSVFAAPNNVIYAIDRPGPLYWFRHDGRDDGSPTWSERKLVLFAADDTDTCRSARAYCAPEALQRYHVGNCG